MANTTTPEKATDFMVHKWLEEIAINAEYQKTSNPEIDKALEGASKSENGNGKGHPEFIFVVDNHLFIIENKNDNAKLEHLENEQITTEFPYRADYAVNGAVHYAKHIVEKSFYKEVIAIGITGNSHSYKIQPHFVSKNNDGIEVRRLDDLKNLDSFAENEINEYWRVQVLGEEPKEERDLKEAKQVAKALHEDLRNYGNLEGERKGTVVSAILLALEEPTFDYNTLKGHAKEGAKDGDYIFNALKTYLEGMDDMRPEKFGILREYFGFVKSDATLNTINQQLKMTPLKYYCEILNKNVVHLVKEGSDVDVLGNFYGEFVRYGGSDGNSLGIVLTPRHITSLMAEIIDVRPHDMVLDPSCGTGAFLISAMGRMLKLAKSKDEEHDIKMHKLHGVELQGKLYTIATTNMILRGDGKSNLLRGDCFRADDSGYFNPDQAKPYQDKVFTKVLMNPPYSQGAKDNNYQLSEISFIHKVLSYMHSEGRLAAIVPQSTMVGSNKVEKEFKQRILENHTLEAVITLNKDTFHGVGVNPCICVFAAGIPHNFDKKLVKFIDFSDDGYEVRKHIGLVDNGTASGKREHLIDVLNDNADDDTKFIVKSLITAEDEWLHSFYYFNDEIPSEEDFKKTIADYLTFQFDMYAHGRGYLFENDEDDE